MTSHPEDARTGLRDRWVIKAGKLTADEIALISKAEVPAEHAHLDEELTEQPTLQAAASGMILRLAGMLPPTS
jgi:hypothetical protein